MGNVLFVEVVNVDRKLEMNINLCYDVEFAKSLYSIMLRADCAEFFPFQNECATCHRNACTPTTTGLAWKEFLPCTLEAYPENEGPKRSRENILAPSTIDA